MPLNGYASLVAGSNLWWLVKFSIMWAEGSAVKTQYCHREESMGENICNWRGERDAHIQAVERGQYQGRLIGAAAVVLPKLGHPL